MAITVGAFEAKTHFSELLARAAGGETVVVAKHGAPVAKLVPLSHGDASRDSVAAFDEILGARPGMGLGGLRSKDLRAEGRR
ncbi:MAG: type II toxin-antitoxin system prevent-host-death family antitoxin [Bifidobacteriaceae bacterium]|jgi:prevent-host-death family protein|nr:type II toxin-antitoxin system prevent-host-death family antitoxin [Bifidobacteriaceae bacterium]